MNSLRSRLILGSALIAVVPLAGAMILLSQRIQQTVRAQAAERLAAALGTLQIQLGADGERMAEKLQIVAKDGLLKRLYLVRPAGVADLSEYLAEKRFLLGLDYLHVVDTSGVVIADGSTAAPPRGGGENDPWRAGAAGPRTPSGLAIAAIEGVPALTMAASAPIRYQGESVGMVRGGVVLDAEFLGRLKRATGVELVLSDGAGHGATTNLDGALPLLLARLEAGRVTLEGRPYLSRSTALDIGPEPHARITALVSTASADRTIGALRTTSVLLGVAGLAIAIVLGAWWSSQVSRPVERLAAFSERIARGHWDEPLALHSVRELQTLVAALDRMRGDLSAYRARLVTSERQAAWSQMARMVAHEVKNPLTPIAVSVADLKRSFEQKRADFPDILDQAVATVAEEVGALKRLLQEFSDFARLPAPVFARCRLSELMADLRSLYGAEVARGRLSFDAPDRDVEFIADRGQLRQALINLIKNGLEAAGDSGRVEVRAGVEGAALSVAVSDNGPGFSAEEQAKLFVPDFTTKAHGSGLGLTIVERIVNDHRGTITVAAEPGHGTTFRILCPLEREA